MAKRSSDSRVAYPEVKVHVWNLVRVVDFVAPFIEKLGETRSTRQGGRHVAKRSSDPRIAFPEVKVQSELWVLLNPLPQGGQYSGKIRFIEPQGIMGTGDMCRVP